MFRGKVNSCLEAALCLRRHRKAICEAQPNLSFCSLAKRTVSRGDAPRHYNLAGLEHLKGTADPADGMLFFPNTASGANGICGSVNFHQPARLGGLNDALNLSSMTAANYVSFGPLGTSILVSPSSARTSENPPNGSVSNKTGMGGNNESLTNSVVLTNDSMSFTDGICNNGPSYLMINSNTQSPAIKKSYSKDETSCVPSSYFLTNSDVKHFNSSQTQRPNQQKQRQRQQPPRSQTQTNMIHTECAYEDSSGSTPGSNLVHPSMTPLLVRLPSGEAGYFVCPKQLENSEQTYFTGSLPKNCEKQLTSGNFFPLSAADRPTSMRHKKNSTLSTTVDTDSEPGRADISQYFHLLTHQGKPDQFNEQNCPNVHHLPVLNRNDLGSSLGSRNGHEVQQMIARVIRGEFKCPSDDAGTTATNNSLMTIDRSNSEADSMQNTAPTDREQAHHLVSRGLDLAAKGSVNMHFNLTTERLQEFTSSVMHRGQVDSELSQSSST